MSTAKEIVTGGSMEDVEFRDGTRSRFELKELSIEQLLKFCDHLRDGKRFELVVLCTGQTELQINRLKSSSFAKLWTAAFNRNFPEAGPLLGADTSLAAEVLPAIRRMGIGAAEILSLAGLESSREPAPEESAAVIGTESSSSPQADSSQSLTKSTP